MEYVIPNRGRIAIGIDWFGTNQTHIEGGSLNILCVSRSISIIGLHLLYGCRRYEVAAENNLHSPRREQADVAMMMVTYMNLRIIDRSAHIPAEIMFTLPPSTGDYQPASSDDNAYRLPRSPHPSHTRTNIHDHFKDQDQRAHKVTS